MVCNFPSYVALTLFVEVFEINWSLLFFLMTLYLKNFIHTKRKFLAKRYFLVKPNFKLFG